MKWSQSHKFVHWLDRQTRCPIYHHNRRWMMTLEEIGRDESQTFYQQWLTGSLKCICQTFVFFQSVLIVPRWCTVIAGMLLPELVKLFCPDFVNRLLNLRLVCDLWVHVELCPLEIKSTLLCADIGSCVCVLKQRRPNSQGPRTTKTAAVPQRATSWAYRRTSSHTNMKSKSINFQFLNPD